MRIVVNDIAAAPGGGLTVLQSFHRYVRDHEQDDEWVFLLGRDALESSTNIQTVVLPKVGASWMRRLTFDLFSGRRLIASLKPDVVLSLQNTVTYGLDCPQVVYVHQSLPFQRAKTFSFLRKDERLLATYQHVIGAFIKRSIRHADRTVVQTQWMREAILEGLGVESDRVEWIPPDLDQPCLSDVRREPDPCAFVYPTSRHIYKNNGCVYQACGLLRQQGMDRFTVTMTLNSAPDPNVRTIGRVSRAEVLDLLATSTLVFPSFVETYGLPLAEARALGGLVLAADLPYAREVLAGYANAYFFNPESPEELAALMREVLNGGIRRVGSVNSDEPARGSDVGTGWHRLVRLLRNTLTARACPK